MKKCYVVRAFITVEAEAPQTAVELVDGALKAMLPIIYYHDAKATSVLVHRDAQDVTESRDNVLRFLVEVKES